MTHFRIEQNLAALKPIVLTMHATAFRRIST